MKYYNILSTTVHIVNSLNKVLIDTHGLQIIAYFPDQIRHELKAGINVHIKILPHINRAMTTLLACRLEGYSKEMRITGSLPHLK